jgi:hypothetical protein
MPGTVTIEVAVVVAAGVTGLVAAACFEAAGVAALVDAAELDELDELAELAELDELAELEELGELDELAELDAAGAAVTDTVVVALGVPGRVGVAFAVAVKPTDEPPAVPDETVICACIW